MRVVVLAPRKTLAKLTFRQIVGVLEGMPGRIDGEPSADRVTVKRDDGRRVSIVVAAASAYGTNVRSGWLAALVLDEAAFFGEGDEGYAVNVADIVNAASTRLLGPLWVITSPNGPKGWVRETFDAHRKDGSTCDACGGPCTWLVAHAPTLTLNPAYDPKEVAKLRARDPDAAAREFDAAWVDADAQWLPTDWVTRALRYDEPPPPDSRSYYVAAMDPATRGNAWTLVIGRVDDEGRTEVSCAMEWQGTREKPLRPGEVLEAVAEACRAYGCERRVYTDQHGFEPLQDLARLAGLSLVEFAWGKRNKVDVFAYLRDAFGEERVTGVRVEGLIRDLANVRRKVTHQGTSIVLPLTPDKRHCDYAPAVAMLAEQLRFAGGPAAPPTEEDRDDEDFGEGDDDADPIARWRGA